MWALITQTIQEWREDKVPQLGAALAFYTALSIAPLLVIALGVSGFFFGKEAASGEIRAQFESMVGDQGAKALEDIIASADKPTAGILATTLSIITLLFGASGVFGELQQSLNTIWEVEPKRDRGFFGMIRDRFLSFAMVMGVAFLLMVSLLISAALASVATILNWLPDWLHWLSEAIHQGASLVVISLLFAMMFKYLPDVRIAWRDVWLGAVMTAVLFTIGKFAIGLYLGHSSMASSYGAAGSFVVLLVWVYYSAQILFLGAEFTQVYANRYGAQIAPAEGAKFRREKRTASPISAAK